MKTRLTLLGLLAILMGACTTGGYVSGTYSDDIYFSPGDVPPPIAVEEVVAQEPVQKSANTMIISNIEREEDGSNTMNNYIFEGSEEDADVLRYNMDQMEMEASDTTVYYNDDEMKYVINNYYDGDELDYAYRIRRFHRPSFYDPFYWDSWSYYDPFYYDPYYYSSWYYPSWSLSWSLGWGGFYSGWGWGWNSPYYGWGHGYYPPYYGSWYGGGWYGGGYYG
ncbi:MAG TPA: hypothetical protein VEP89_11445, partial [Draconibacterium sp.]|nr:hypothetical protein [Draconibacterium sp.]